MRNVGLRAEVAKSCCDPARGQTFPMRDMDAGELTALLTEISLLPVVSKMLEAYKKDGGRE